ncbi:hypothetical protein CALCODRAFT_495754 [Calocera cornea HHB12733]|uniref:Uncharacterized protein n=1 Tax=Calocera cornea HHB12733 TaxID=1353952 RepID=A0A165G888_9BASI|nr:hypothetical protein CALCODRAFT_495754 [Calocera cornea HHB12733]
MSNEGEQPPHSNQPVNGDAPDAAATQLADLLYNLKAFDPTDPSSAQNVGQLLKSLEQADGIAKGVDSRLDTLLKDLEGMIGAMEKERAEGRAPQPGEESRIEEEKEEVETELASEAQHFARAGGSQNARE